VFGEKLFTKLVKIGLFILQKQDVGLAKIASMSQFVCAKKESRFHDLKNCEECEKEGYLT